MSVVIHKPYVTRSGLYGPLYLPLPLESRKRVLSRRVVSVDSAFISGVFILGSENQLQEYTFTGQAHVNNPQDTVVIASLDALWMRLFNLSTFFLAYPGVPFNLYLTIGGTASVCFCTEFSFNVDMVQPGIADYAISFIRVPGV